MDLDKKEQDGGQDFRFIEEKVVPRRRKKLKRLIFNLLSTVMLAAVFGVVARYVFVSSEPWINKVLGIEERQPEKNTLPSIKPSVTLTPSISPTPIMTPTPVVEESGTVIEQKINATADDYVKMIYDLKQIALKSYPSLVTVAAVESGIDWFNEVYEKQSLTTGAIISINRVNIMIMASYEEIKDASYVKVSFCNDAVAQATLYNYDADYDIAILSVPVKDLAEETLLFIKEVTLGESYSLTGGVPIIAVGNPNGYTGSFDFGIVTRKASPKSIIDGRVDLYQTNLISYPESGRMILNIKGDLVACVTHKLLGDLDDTVITAVGISRITPVLERLINKTDCIYFGIVADDIPQTVLDEFELPHGIYVSEMRTDSPAFVSGIKRGDIITGINDFTISSVNTFISILNGYQAGDTVKVNAKRMVKQVYKDIEISITLDAKGN